MHILRFGLENFGCFRDYAEVSFISTSQRDQPDFRIRHPDFSYGILPVVGIFGANASGKSQLLDGLLHAVHLVRQSFSRFDPEQPIPRNPWRLDKSVGSNPSRFDIDLLLDGVRHHYGFVHSSEEFTEEWLHRWPTGRRQVLFERDASAESPWYFGPSLTGEKSSLASFTRPNSLFLSTAAHHNHEILKPIAAAISRDIEDDSFGSGIPAKGYPIFEEGAPILDPKRREQVENVIRAFDVGCNGFEVEEVHFTALEPPQEFENLLDLEELEEVRNHLSQTRYRIRLTRKAEDGGSWTLPPSLESRGTSVLLQRINDILLVESGLLVIDELDTSLHPDICAALVNLFSTKGENERSIQLLFSTHHRDLMNHLRRDEVVLVEKNVDGASTVSTAADFKRVRGRDDLSQIYEDGRMGAVPILGNLDPLLEARDGA